MAREKNAAQQHNDHEVPEELQAPQETQTTLDEDLMLLQRLERAWAAQSDG